MMKVMWLCNTMPPVIGVYLGLETSVKEGWISGLLSQVLADESAAYEMAVAFPVKAEQIPEGEELLTGMMQVGKRQLSFYGFYEDTTHPECYDEGLESRLQEVLRRFGPDMVHIFGTEYPHTLAMTRVFKRPERILIGIQGLCSQCARAYLADLPEKVVKGRTLRDFMKKDSILQQQEKFARRGEMEIEAIKNAGHVTGRTAFDKEWTERFHPNVTYHLMNETLRSPFYEGIWEWQQAQPGRIFVSQGDYPLKGLHYMISALSLVRGLYKNAELYVAGDCVVKGNSLKEKLKISSYGRYLKRLIRQYHLEDAVHFLGRVSPEDMKEQYLKCSAYVCCSTLENSPNSLGEAMLMGVPCVAADVGGIPSMLKGGRDGILYQGFRYAEEDGFERNAIHLARAVFTLWGNWEQSVTYCENAREHAKITHDGEKNYEVLKEIYQRILEG